MILLYTLENLLFPPALTLGLALAGWLARRAGHRRLGKGLLGMGLVSLYLFGLPATSRLLAGVLEGYPPLDGGDCEGMPAAAQAIVVLAYTRYDEGPEYGGDMSSGEEMERLRYAAYLHRCHPLPVFVVGGDALNTGIREADLMRHTLETYFQVPVAAGDGRSRHTRDNAAYAGVLLREAGIDRVLLVTHAWHMARAVRLFRDAGIHVIPAPTRFTTFNPLAEGLLAWIPTASSLRHNKRLIHELVGMGLHSLWPKRGAAPS